MSGENDVSRSAIIKRIGQIIAVLIKYDLPVTKLFPSTHAGLPKEKPGASKMSVNRRWRLAIQELGPTFIKFGQMMSTRPDLLSPELCAELNMLTDDVKAVPWETIEPVIEEYCSPIDQNFVYFNKRPLASASLSQAYLGKLKDGTVVVLKAQRPGIKDLIDVDLQILRMIARKTNSSPELQLFNFPEAAQEFSNQLLAELDFTRDGRNADLLAKNMKTIHGVRIPKIYWKYSGQRLLVMEYMKGVRIDKLEQIKKMKVDPKKIALLGLHAYWKQIFDDGFFHGDPHPGNLLVTVKGELVFLDFGLFGVIRPEKRDLLLKIFLGLVENDVNLIVDGLSSYGLAVEDSKQEAFKDDIYAAMLENEYKTIKPNDVFLSELIGILRKYGLVVPTTVMLMLKVFGMVQELCSNLYPDFVLYREIKPLLAKSLETRMEKEMDVHQIGLNMLDRFDRLKEFPKLVTLALKQVSKGSFILKIPDEDLSRFEKIADRTSYRILLGLIVASIVIGMSLVLFATQRILATEQVQIAVLVYAVAIFIVLFATVQLLQAREKH